MTSGQQRALRELDRLHAANPDEFEIVGPPEEISGWLRLVISLRLGPMESRPGGLDFRDREDFVLLIPSDFPFDQPSLVVTHSRFAGFPHVNWSRHICLYQSSVEWNPGDGLFGFFERLRVWLGRAAMNDMDPVEGPLHPPVSITDWSLLPFVIRADMPVEAGQSWIGLAELEKHSNRFELVGWNDLTRAWPTGRYPALAVVMAQALPVEFPENGQGFFAELAKQGIDKQKVLTYLRIAAKITPPNESAYLVLAIPMRRSPAGTPLHHIVVWAVDPENAGHLRTGAPVEDESAELATIKTQLNDLTYRIFELTKIKWCPVMEDRTEIVVRRDAKTSVAWFAGKKVLILGCGALGSWAAEIVGRANPQLIHLVDNAIVKPGLLARQNYRLEDIGSNKARALSVRLKAIVQGSSIEHFNREAHGFAVENAERFNGYDVVLDCTASSIFQMKMERDWHIWGYKSPAIVSIIIDATARRCLGVALGSSSSGGVWDAYVQLKHRLCLEGTRKDIIAAFYSERAAKDLFQPEPGCSDPTFSGSTADVFSLVSTALNVAVSQIASGCAPVGLAFSSHAENKPGKFDVLKLSHMQEAQAGNYRIRIHQSVFSEARGWVRQNNRARSRHHETGGLLWGLWDDAVGVIWLFDASGPPPDSLHDPGHFVCGIMGTVEEHRRRVELIHGSGFIGFWHTHPDMSSVQSGTDIRGMGGLVSGFELNQRRALMLIFGRTGGQPTAGVYIYESHSRDQSMELISVGLAQIQLGAAVV